MLQKRSLSIAGHRSSVALEPEFWAALEHAAVARSISIPALVVQIDSQRDPENSLASAIRVFLLREAQQG